MHHGETLKLVPVRDRLGFMRDGLLMHCAWDQTSPCTNICPFFDLQNGKEDTLRLTLHCGPSRLVFCIEEEDPNAPKS